MTVSAVIPNWNRRDLLVGVLNDLRAQTHPPVEMIVVDNGSADGSAEAARSAGAKVFALPVNHGFAFAVNRGIEAARGDWIAVLNNDVTLPREWLATLLLGAADAHFASGKLLRASHPREVDGGFDLLCRGGCAWRAGQGRQDGPAWDHFKNVFFVPFTAAIFRRDLFENVGLLDEDFESYLEDVDFGLRCALQGLTGVYVPQAIAYHAGSATLGVWNPETVRRLARNQLLLVIKHYPSNWIRRYGWHVLVAQLLWGGVALRHGAGWAFLKGKWQALRLRPRSRHLADAARLDQVLHSSEADLRALQKETGFDLYWRLYFSLT